MKCQTTELEIETIVNRIKNGDLDLQPDFQRGEIWTPQKKKKLIDSILRGWRIPPIHVVQLPKDRIDEVLDGQQRLAAIRDFYDEKLSIDGSIEPLDEEIQKLDSLYYSDLPKEWQREFRQYSVNVIRLTEYAPQEPAELFYRLNQPTALTSAEQRNAYMGIPRDQIKRLSDLFVQLGANKDTIGFSNSRLAYDEIISKFCYSVETHSIRQKITSTDLSEQYRQNTPFTDSCIDTVEQTIHTFAQCIFDNQEQVRLSLNKATLFSWFVYIRQNLNMSIINLRNVILSFEFCRAYVKGTKKKDLDNPYLVAYERIQNEIPFLDIMLTTFNQRTSMGSTDALSIIYRDIIITLFQELLLQQHSSLMPFALQKYQETKNVNLVLEEIATSFNWGDLSL